MNSAILNELNIIRIREQRKLLFKIQEHLNSIELNDQSLVSDLFRQLVKVTKENQHDINYNTAVVNYKKLSKTLLLLTKKNKRISSNLQVIKKSLTKSKRFFLNPQKNTDTAFQSIQDDLEEINLKIKSFIPEQLNLNPLGPFNFINEHKEIIKGMVSIFILNENSANHLKNLFDSFIKTNTCTDYSFIIIDRGSSDHCLEIIKSYKDKLPLELISYDQKFTNSYLYDMAIDSCQSEFLLFLNNKVIFRDDLLPVYLDLFSHDSSYGLIGASLSISDEYSSNTEHFGSIRFAVDDIPGQPDIPFPLVDLDFLLKSGIETTFKDYRNTNGVYIPPGTFLTCLKPVAVSSSNRTDPEVVPAVLGSALMCRKIDFIHAGGFDLNYFNGYEDIDLCLKFATRLNKKSLLAHRIKLQLNVNDLLSEFGLSDEFGSNYNLGVLLNNNGYFIKNKYLQDIIGKNRFWTSESFQNLSESKRFVGSLLPEPSAGSKNSNSKISADKIISGYLDDFRNKKIRVAIKIPAFNDERAEFWGDYHFAHALKKAFIKKGHPARVDLFEAWHEYGYLTDDVVIVLRGIKKYQTRGSQINIMWNISHPEQIEESEYREYDHIFIASNVFADELKAKFNIPAETLLQCTDPELFYQDTTNIKDEEKTDILFVANSRGIMRKSIEFSMIKGIPVTIYGTNWEKFLPPEMIKGNYIKNEELRRYYSNCNILLNDHWKDMASNGFISNRLFDAMACGAIILTDPVNGIEDTFSNSIYFYRNAEELAEQVTWIKAHFEEAKQMALMNINAVREKHSFDKRVERILEVVMDIHRHKC